MSIKHLPNHLIGKTLMQISDIHVGYRFDYQYIIDSFVEAQNLAPDYVVYTGDYVNYEIRLRGHTVLSEPKDDYASASE